MRTKKKDRTKRSNPYKGLRRGYFTRQAKSHGMTVPEYTDYVLKHYHNKGSGYNPRLTTYRRALFVKNLTGRKK